MNDPVFIGACESLSQSIESQSRTWDFDVHRAGAAYVLRLCVPKEDAAALLDAIRQHVDSFPKS